MNYKNLERCAKTPCDGKSYCHHMKVFRIAMDMIEDGCTSLNKANLLVILLEIGTSCKRLVSNKTFQTEIKRYCDNYRDNTLLLTDVDIESYYDTAFKKRTRSGTIY